MSDPAAFYPQCPPGHRIRHAGSDGQVALPNFGDDLGSQVRDFPGDSRAAAFMCEVDKESLHVRLSDPLRGLHESYFVLRALKHLETNM